MNNFVVYSKTGCPYCDKVKKVLESLDVNLTIYQLNVDFSREQFYDEFGEGSTFPQVVVGDKKIGGCSSTIKYLKENKYV
jgi:glutaredoxin